MPGSSGKGRSPWRASTRTPGRRTVTWLPTSGQARPTGSPTSTSTGPASASHGLRSPLTSIIGYVEILADGDEGPLRPRQATMLDAVDRNARRLMTLIENMLTTAKIEMGGFTTRRIPVDLAGLVSAAAEVIKPSAITGGLDLEVSPPTGELVRDGEPDPLDRVPVNLLSTACNS